MIETLPRMFVSMDGSRTVDEFRDIMLPQLGGPFNADIVNFVRFDLERAGSAIGADLDVLGRRWCPKAQDRYDDEIRLSDPIVALMDRKVHESHFNTIKLSAFPHSDYNSRFGNFLAGLNAPNLLTIVISVNDTIWASISAGRSTAKGDFSDQEMGLAELMATNFNSTFRAMIDRLNLKAHTLAISEMRRQAPDYLLGVADGTHLLYWNDEVADRFDICQREAFPDTVAGRRPASADFSLSHTLARFRKASMVVTSRLVEIDGNELNVIRCRPLAANAPELGDQQAPTPRELEIIRLICRGHSAQSIAAELGISVWTVKNHLKNIYAKQGVSSRVELAQIFPTACHF